MGVNFLCNNINKQRGIFCKSSKNKKHAKFLKSRTTAMKPQPKTGCYFKNPVVHLVLSKD